MDVRTESTNPPGDTAHGPLVSVEGRRTPREESASERAERLLSYLNPPRVKFPDRVSWRRAG